MNQVALYYLNDAMLACYWLCTRYIPVCLPQASITLDCIYTRYCIKTTRKTELMFGTEASFTYSTLCWCKEICVLNIKVLLSGTLFQTPDLENFTTAGLSCFQQKNSSMTYWLSIIVYTYHGRHAVTRPSNSVSAIQSLHTVHYTSIDRNRNITHCILCMDVMISIFFLDPGKRISRLPVSRLATARQ